MLPFVRGFGGQSSRTCLLVSNVCLEIMATTASVVRNELGLLSLICLLMVRLPIWGFKDISSMIKSFISGLLDIFSIASAESFLAMFACFLRLVNTNKKCS